MSFLRFLISSMNYIILLYGNQDEPDSIQVCLILKLFHLFGLCWYPLSEGNLLHCLTSDQYNFIKELTLTVVRSAYKLLELNDYNYL